MANVNNGAATDAATANTTAPEAAPSTPEAAPSTPEAAVPSDSLVVETNVSATIFTEFALPHYITGTFKGNDGKTRVYELIACQIAVGEHVHDALFRQTQWDEIAKASAPSSTVVVKGTLRHARDVKKRYIVNAKDPVKRYERLVMSDGKLEDIVDTKGSALAFRRGVRRETFDELKARYNADVDVDVSFTEEPKADLG